jgi:glycosyltransferase involved in cell wall biosynthesis
MQRIDSLFNQRRPWAPPIPDPEAMLALRQIVSQERPDVVHGHDWLARSLLPLNRRTGPRFVMSLHYYTVSCAKKSLMYHGAPCSGPAFVKCVRCGSAHYGAVKGPAVVVGNFAFAAAERRAVDLFLPVSHATVAGNGLIGSGLPYEVVPNFVPDAEPVSRDAERLLVQLPEQEFFLFVGDLRREKGIDVLLDAYRALPGAPPLVLIGKVWPDSPRELPPNVRLLTGWHNEAVREAQRRCLALVAPSIWLEPFGMVVIETLAAGRPVIASQIGGMAELVRDGVNGLVLPPGDPVALSKAMAALLEDDRLVARLAEHAARSATRFRAAVIVPRFERAYERALDGPLRGPISRPRAGAGRERG